MQDTGGFEPPREPWREGCQGTRHLLAWFKDAMVGCLVLTGNDLGFGYVPLRPDTLSDASAARDVVDGNAALLGDAVQPVKEH